jgi:hypothetical protein
MVTRLKTAGVPRLMTMNSFPSWITSFATTGLAFGTEYADGWIIAVAFPEPADEDEDDDDSSNKQGCLLWNTGNCKAPSLFLKPTLPVKMTCMRA